VFRWMTELSRTERKTMLACFSGWSLDAFDIQIYSFVIPTLIAAWGITRAQAGVLGTVTILVSAFGGWLSGALSDRFGRVRMMQIMILWFAFFTFLSGFTTSFGQLFICRALQGLGFGGEWAAGAVLMGEVIRDKFRGRAVGFVQAGWAVGWGAAAIVFTLVFTLLPHEIAWRAIFWAGLLPAALVFWVRRHIHESKVYTDQKAATPEGLASSLFSVFNKQYRNTTARVCLLTTGAQGGSYTFLIWLPTYLKTSRGLSVIGTGGFTFVLILGALLGILCGAFLCDAIGRRRTFIISALGAGAMLVLYLMAPLSDTAMLILGLPLGFMAFMMFAPMGPYMSELFPTQIRATAQGFCYNFGRGVGAIFPALIGLLTNYISLGSAIAVFGATGYLVMLVGALLLPETAGTSLSAVYPLDADSDHFAALKEEF
jgi:MFS family permease